MHELLRPDPREYASRQFRKSLLAEGHARLATPLYNIALVLWALAFMVRGQLQKLGYGRRIAFCAFSGFVIRLTGFAVASAAEGDVALNAFQYAIPVLVSAVALAYLLQPARARGIRYMFKPIQKRERVEPTE